MQVEYILFVDAFTIDQGGKLNVLGVHDRLFTREFPTVVPEIVAVACLSFSPLEVHTEATLTILVSNNKGHEIAKQSGPIRPPQNTMTKGKLRIHIPVPLINVEVNEPGPVTLTVTLNKHTLNKELEIERITGLV